MIEGRVLEQFEWDRVKDRPPYDQTGLPAKDGHWEIIIVEDRTGEILASCAIFDTVHWDSWWIDPAHQGKAGAFRALVAQGLDELNARQIVGVHTTVPDTRPDLQELVERFGFMPAPGKLFLLHVPDAKI